MDVPLRDREGTSPRRGSGRSHLSAPDGGESSTLPVLIVSRVSLHTRTLFRSHSHILTHSRSHTLLHKFTYKHSPTFTRTHTCSHSHTHNLTFTLPPTHTHARRHTQPHTHTPTQPHTHKQDLTLARPDTFLIYRGRRFPWFPDCHLRGKRCVSLRLASRC